MDAGSLHTSLLLTFLADHVKGCGENSRFSHRVTVREGVRVCVRVHSAKTAREPRSTELALS